MFRPALLGAGFSLFHEVGVMDKTSANPERVIVVIPARYGSTRFPGKALADLGGRPLIVRVMENASHIQGVDRLVAATDDERIYAAVSEAGFEVVMTGDHDTGTGRVGEVAAGDPADIIVNLQGDEPLLQARTVENLLLFLADNSGVSIATCAHPFTDTESWCDPNAVKVLVDRRDFALYFSRASIPGTFPGGDGQGYRHALRHIGIYAYRRAALENFLALGASELEKCEGLEQLRILEAGERIGVVRVDAAPVGVDTPEDLAKVRRLWSSS